jgi:catechol 2,3-dioxygenase-like lactoylglutathione lyase family enzyme
LTNATPHFTPNFIEVTPFMIVEDLEKALAFFVDLLDFEVQLRWPDYAYVQRETAGFRIWQQTGKDAAPPGTRRFAYYIDVHDVDRLYAKLRPKLDLLARGRRSRPS